MQWQCRHTAETLASRMRADRDLYREVTTCRDRITSTAVRPRGKHGGGARAAEPLLCPARPTLLCVACLLQLVYVATHARAPRALSPHRPPPPRLVETPQLLLCPLTDRRRRPGCLL